MEEENNEAKRVLNFLSSASVYYTNNKGAVNEEINKYINNIIIFDTRFIFLIHSQGVYAVNTW